jgi:5-methylcytosine-specific restriction endonuclease McrA
MRTCTNPKCKRANPQELTEFCKDKTRKSGLFPHCKSCVKDYKFNYYLKNKEKLDTIHMEYYKKNRETVATQKAVHHIKNRSKILIQQAIYRLKNKETIAIKVSAWQKTNPGKVNAISAKRHAKKLRATPPWLTKEQREEIQDLYIEASKRTKETRLSHHVDHIVPLQGESVSGLHVPWNLQILTAKENLSKKNKIIL